MKDSYEDIISLPHHVSDTRPHMSVSDRAAQFSPFAALTGYDEKIRETARLTEKRVQLTEYQYELLNEKMSFIRDHIDTKPRISVTYFVPDEKKEGGSYTQFDGQVKKLKEDSGALCFTDGTEIPLQSVTDIAIHY